MALHVMYLQITCYLCLNLCRVDG